MSLQENSANGCCFRISFAYPERQQILAALEQAHWDKMAAAKLLGITLRALRYRLEKLGLD